jgi:iron-sulfur cluster repair protein YtfE (RIC family)
MTVSSSIKISETTRRRLYDMRQVPGVTYDDAISHLLDVHDSPDRAGLPVMIAQCEKLSGILEKNRLMIIEIQQMIESLKS